MWNLYFTVIAPGAVVMWPDLVSGRSCIFRYAHRGMFPRSHTLVIMIGIRLFPELLGSHLQMGEWKVCMGGWSISDVHHGRHHTQEHEALPWFPPPTLRSCLPLPHPSRESSPCPVKHIKHVMGCGHRWIVSCGPRTHSNFLSWEIWPWGVIVV